MIRVRQCFSSVGRSVTDFACPSPRVSVSGVFDSPACELSGEDRTWTRDTQAHTNTHMHTHTHKHTQACIYSKITNGGENIDKMRSALYLLIIWSWFSIAAFNLLISIHFLHSYVFCPYSINLSLKDTLSHSSALFSISIFPLIPLLSLNPQPLLL